MYAALCQYEKFKQLHEHTASDVLDGGRLGQMGCPMGCARALDYRAVLRRIAPGRAVGATTGASRVR